MFMWKFRLNWLFSLNQSMCDINRMERFLQNRNDDDGIYVLRLICCPSAHVNRLTCCLSARDLFWKASDVLVRNMRSFSCHIKLAHEKYSSRSVICHFILFHSNPLVWNRVATVPSSFIYHLVQIRANPTTCHLHMCVDWNMNYWHLRMTAYPNASKLHRRAVMYRNKWCDRKTAPGSFSTQHLVSFGDAPKPFHSKFGSVASVSPCLFELFVSGSSS